MISIDLGNKTDLAWAQDIVSAYHYLGQRVHNQARPMVYVIRAEGKRLGVIMAGIPHATKVKGHWGYPGLPTQWQVVDLCRILINPRLQRGGDLAQPGRVPGFIDRRGEWRPTVASWAIGEVLGRVQQDRISLWPPVFPDLPYHIRLVVSYHDPAFHKGTIYRVSGARPMYTDERGQARPGPAGKFGWYWPLPEPDWGWEQINILRPRNLRLPLEV